MSKTWVYGTRFRRVEPIEHHVKSKRRPTRIFKNIKLLRTDFKNLIPLLNKVKGKFRAKRTFYVWKDFLVYEYGKYPILFLHKNGRFYVEKAWLTYPEWNMTRIENHCTFYARQLKKIGAMFYQRRG